MHAHGHAGPSTAYARRKPEAGVLYRALQRHLATFLNGAAQAQDGAGLPQFVEKELHAFLKCGVLAHGFSRFRCTDCRFERLVPLSCKGRGFCPSCGGKRMTDIAAHLTDCVMPQVPVRQFVLSFPYWLRYRLAYDHDRCTAVLRIFLRGVLGFYRRRARERGVLGGRGGSVTFVQRFGSAANLNLHAHAIVLDGVFAERPSGELRFHHADPPSDADIAALLRLIRTRIVRHVERHGLLQNADADPFSAEAPLLASCYATSIAHRQTLGGRPGARLHRLGDPDTARVEHRAHLQAHLERFDLHAGLTIAAQHAHGRIALEKLLRYCARPPIAQNRLSELPDGRITLQLKTPWSDGTTHVIYEPLDLIAKLDDSDPNCAPVAVQDEEDWTPGDLFVHPDIGGPGREPCVIPFSVELEFAQNYSIHAQAFGDPTEEPIEAVEGFYGGRCGEFRDTCCSESTGFPECFNLEHKCQSCTGTRCRP